MLQQTSYLQPSSVERMKEMMEYEAPKSTCVMILLATKKPKNKYEIQSLNACTKTDESFEIRRQSHRNFHNDHIFYYTSYSVAHWEY